MPDVRSRFPVSLALLVFLAVTPAWAKQPAVLIPATDAPPKIDGRIEPSEWDDAAVIKRDEPVYMNSHQIELWLTPPVADAKTWAYQFIGNAYGAFFDNQPYGCNDVGL